MSRALQRVLTALGLLLLFERCAADQGDPRIVLQIESDLSVPAELDRITVAVVGQTQAAAAEADLRTQGLPRTVTLAHSSGPLGPVQVWVRGWLGQTAQVEKRLALYFRADVEERVLVTLSRDCLSVICPATQTCERGACAPVQTTSSGVDAAVTGDGGPVSPADAGRDAGGFTEAGTARDAGPGGDAGGGPGDPTRDAGTTLPPDAGPRDAGPPDTGVPVTPPGPGQKPVCSVERPLQNDVVQVNAPLMLRGTCTDPETGPLTSGLSWTSQVDGALGTGSALTVMLRSTGRQRLTLCGSDPRDVVFMGCVNVEVIATDVAQPAALITSVSQNGSEIPPFVVGQQIQLRGAGTGAGVTLSWSDSLQGALGTGPMVTIQAPLQGQHTVTLTVRDRDGKTATRTVDFMVRPRAPIAVP